jgi:hypothetical protein
LTHDSVVQPALPLATLASLPPDGFQAVLAPDGGS